MRCAVINDLIPGKGPTLFFYAKHVPHRVYTHKKDHIDIYTHVINKQNEAKNSDKAEREETNEEPKKR